VGFNDEEEVDVFDLSEEPSKSDDYSTETNMFAVEFDVSEGKRANPVQASVPPSSAFADDEDEFDLNGGASASIDDDDDDDFPSENEGFFSKIKGMFAKPDIDDDIDTDVDFDDADGDFSGSDDFPAEIGGGGGGFFSKIKGIFAKPDVDEDIDADTDLADADFSDSDEFPAENEGFFSKIKGMFAKPADMDDLDDDFNDVLPDDDADYTPVLDKSDSGVFEMSSSAATPAEPEFEEFEAVKAGLETAKADETAEPEFEAVKAEFEALGSKPEPVAAKSAPREEESDEFDVSASAPPPPPVPVILPPPVFDKIAHVSLSVKNLQASIDFYTKLGFTKRFVFNKNGRLFGVYLEFGRGNFIEIFEDTRPKRSGASKRTVGHFCLETPNIDTAIESLSSRGIEHTPKKSGADSTYQIWLKDPDGNEFEIHQYTPESSQLTGKDVEADW